MASVESMNGAPRMAPDADFVGGLGAVRSREQDRDERDHRLRQGRADGGQDAADRALGQVQLVAEPLDAVGEELGARRG